MRKSIVFKTAFVVSTALMFVMGIVGWFVYSAQEDIIKQLQTDKKNTILKYINKAEQDTIDQELDTLESLADSLKSGLTNALYNSDVESAKVIVEQLLDNDSIKAILIYDSSVEEIFLVGSKTNDHLKFSSNLPSDIAKKFKFFKFDMRADGENIGYFNVYYDTSNVMSKIKQIKEQEILTFNKKVQQLNKQINRHTPTHA
jgi:hypothetical protein